MKHKEELDSFFRKLKDKGLKIDPHHHTHSPYEFDDGVAINKGDWLKNEWCRKTKKGGVSGVCTVLTKERLDSLLFKQALFEKVCGYATVKEQLYWYVMEYYCSSIDYIADFDDNINWLSKIEKAVDKAWAIPLEEIDVETMRDNSKVKVDTVGRTKEEVGKLAKVGEKIYNQWIIGEFVKKNPGMSKKWYMRNAAERIGVSESTVKRYLRGV